MSVRELTVEVGGVDIRVVEQGDVDGPAVLMIHGFPDSHRLWRHQVGPLVEAGYRVVTPDLRGYGASGAPAEVEGSNLFHHVSDLTGVLDELGIGAAHVVGHDWGSAIAWLLATIAADRVRSLTAISVGHPSAFQAAGIAQREKSWYMLYFQFPGVAEAWFAADDFAAIETHWRHPDSDEVAAYWREDPARIASALAIYRANVAPESFLAPPMELPPVTVPTMGVWSSGDLALVEEQITRSSEHVTGPWRYERIEGAGHWIPLDAPERLTGLLLEHVGSLQG